MKNRSALLLKLILLVGMSLMGLGIWFVCSLQQDLNSQKPSILLLDRRGEYLGEIPGQGGRLGYWALPPQLPDKVVLATLQTEDRNFYEHSGVYLPSLGRALVQRAHSGRIISGGSTIAMQVARMQKPGQRNLLRKVREMFEGWLLVRTNGHNLVLRQYLTIAPYGHRVHGILRAARLYFNKPIEDLSWLQAAYLAGLPQSPGRMDPYRPEGLRRGLSRAHRILHTLHNRGMITAIELEQALRSDLGLVPKPRRSSDAMHISLRLSDMAAQRSGPIEHATIDMEIQSQVANLLTDNLDRLRKMGAGNTAAMVVDWQTGEVLAYVGSADYFDNIQHGAIDYVRAKRSPGSTLKPFIYALGLQKGLFTAASELPDTQVEFDWGKGRTYLPRNITQSYMGPMLLRDALGNSRNIPVLHVLSALGVEQALSFFELSGIQGVSFDPGAYGLSLALGALPVTLEELVGMYGLLARQGESMNLRYFLEESPKPSSTLLDAGVAALVTNILSDSAARLPTFKRGGSLEYEYAVAVKTGTSQGHRDGWTIAFSDRLLVGVWVGNHDWRRMDLKLGGQRAGSIVVHRMLDALMPSFQPYKAVATAFPPPETYETKTICSLSGLLTGPDCPHHRMEFFSPGSAPYQFCTVHARIKIDRRNGLLANSSCDKRFIDERVMLRLPTRYENWASHEHLELAPADISPLCGGFYEQETTQVIIHEPKNRARYQIDPDTPPEFSTIRLAAQVHPRTEELIWVVDGSPIAKVSYPFEYRLPLTPGTHSIMAVVPRRNVRSGPLTIVVRE